MLDKIKFEFGGKEIFYSEYFSIYIDLLKWEEWIIDGFGCVLFVWEWFVVVDILVFIDFLLFMYYCWVIKRLVKGLFFN